MPKNVESAKPAYGCQVTIQSEQERQMMKLYRREEKKERKRERRGDEGEQSEALFHFDPKELRLQRYDLFHTFYLCVFFFLHLFYRNRHRSIC